MKKPVRNRSENTGSQVIERLSASLEDYLQVIFHLEESHRVARAKEIAAQMKVQRASVTGALKALASRGLINYSPYSHITLTVAGRHVAQDIVRRHNTLREFFGSQAGPISRSARPEMKSTEYLFSPKVQVIMVDLLSLVGIRCLK